MKAFLHVGTPFLCFQIAGAIYYAFLMRFYKSYKSVMDCVIDLQIKNLPFDWK